MSGRKRKKVAAGGAGAGPKPVVIHPPSPYPAGSRAAAASLPSKPSTVYHGDVDVVSPVLTPAALQTTAPKRATAIDALRGLFLLSMTLGFALEEAIFPTWMYHRQYPPPLHQFVDIAGISWRDVTYGAFLFSMAAAIPITLGLRISRGATELGIIFAALRRGFMLFVFALLIGHSNTFFLGYTQTARVIGIVGFFLTFLIFTRPRKDWNQERFERLQRWGWLAVIAFLALTPLLYGKTFSIERRDDIISELAFAAAIGWIIWYFTRTRIIVRLLILALASGLFLAAQHAGPVQDFWASSPLPWIWTNSELVLLSVVIPGTIAGDLVLRWSNTPEPADNATVRWSRGRSVALLLLTLAATPVLVVGMYHRWVPGTTIALLVLCAAAIALAYRTHTPTEKLVGQLILWSSGFLMLGMALEPLYGGMRKVPDNLSYFFAIGGISMLLMTAATIVTELLNGKRAVKFLTEVGQNPMLCYILFSVFLNSLLELFPATRTAMLGNPATSLLRTLLCVAVVAFITREFTRRGIFWRA